MTEKECTVKTIENINSTPPVRRHPPAKSRITPADFHLYVVTDRTWLGEDRNLAVCVEQAILGGATMVQVREKDLNQINYLNAVLEVKKITDRYGIPLIVNDRMEVAYAADAAGVHLGQQDVPVAEARAILGDHKLIGVSAHTLEEALQAERDGADYLGVGAVFPTHTKKDTHSVSFRTLQEICARVHIPVVAIGGIQANNISLLTDSGIDGVAVISAIFSSEDIRSAAQELSEAASAIADGRAPAGQEASEYQAAIFDYDGTILDSMPMWEQAASNFVRSLGREPAEGLDWEIRKLSLEQSAEKLRSEYGAVGTDEEIVAALIAMVTEEYKYALQPKRGITKILDDLRAHGIRMAIATASTREMIMAANKRLGLDKYFEEVFTCGEVGADKREPDIYRKAAEFLQSVPSKTLVFEDVEHAVKTASAAGFPVVAVRDRSSEADRKEIEENSILYLEEMTDWPGIEALSRRRREQDDAVMNRIRNRIAEERKRQRR